MAVQFLCFSLVGISSAVVNFAVYNMSRFALAYLGVLPDYEYIPALIVGFLLSVLWAYFFSRRYVFSSKEEQSVPWTKALPRMYLAYGFTGFVMNVLLSMLWVEVLGVPEAVISLINDTLAAPVNFFLIKYWSFGGQ